MKYKLLMGCALLASSLTSAWGGEVFDGYPAFYKSLPTRLFKEADARTLLNSYSENGESLSFSWDGKVNGKSRYVEIDGGKIRIDNTRLKITKAVVFPGETADASDFSIGTQVYFADGYTCIDSDYASASGTAARHRSVYLINTKLKPIYFIKLPSLFASCLEIHRYKKTGIAFYKSEYRYGNADKDRPTGMTLTEYTSNGKSFSKTDVLVNTVFLEPENVFKFSIEQAP